MNNNGLAKSGLLSAVAVILQISAGFIPGIGHLLSVFTTLPIQIITSQSWKNGIISFNVAGVLIIFIQPLEAPIFFCATGLIGLLLGLADYLNFSYFIKTLLTSLGLTMGIIIAIEVLGIPLFGGLTINLSFVEKLFLYLGFAYIYITCWQYLFKKFVNYMFLML